MKNHMQDTKFILMFGIKLCATPMDLAIVARPESLARFERSLEMCGLVFKSNFH